jgi:hypothetical protein
MKYVTVTFLLALSLKASVPRQNPKVIALRQPDCPVVVEQHENSNDGSLKSADLKNRSEKTVDSIRVGWIFQSSSSAEPTDIPGKVVELRPGLTAGGRITLASGEMGIPSFPPNTNRVEFYVASGYFSDGKRFTCSARSKSKD